MLLLIFIVVFYLALRLALLYSTSWREEIKRKKQSEQLKDYIENSSYEKDPKNYGYFIMEEINKE
jgi:hypothetical protein